MNNKNKRHYYSAYNFYLKDIRLVVEEEYSKNVLTEECLNKDVINKLCGEKWKKEFYDIKLKYEMFAVLDRLRYLKETNMVLKYPYDVIENEKDNFIKEEIIRKICHFKLIFENLRSLNNDAKYMIYYNINFNNYFNPFISVDEISKNIYMEFMKLSEAQKNKFIQDNNINIKEISEDIIDIDAIKYLPSRMAYLIKLQNKSNDENDLQTNKFNNNHPIKRKVSQELDVENHKHIKLSYEYKKSVDLDDGNNIIEVDQCQSNDNDINDFYTDCVECLDLF